MALSRPAFDPADLNRELDIAAVNPYYAMQDALTMPAPPPEAALGTLALDAGSPARGRSTCRPT